MGEVRITVDGLRTLGRHGANPGERLEPQEFVVDLEVVADRADDEDSLETVIDYRVLASMVRDVVATRSFELLETLADAVARAVYELPLVTEVTVVVHKPAAASELDAEDVSAEVTYV